MFVLDVQMKLRSHQYSQYYLGYNSCDQKMESIWSWNESCSDSTDHIAQLTVDYRGSQERFAQIQTQTLWIHIFEQMNHDPDFEVKKMKKMKPYYVVIVLVVTVVIIIK